MLVFYTEVRLKYGFNLEVSGGCHHVAGAHSFRRMLDEV